jgi:hypothetical protein
MLFFGGWLFAESGEDDLSIRVDSGPQPRTGQIWTVIIYVDHPLPGEVEISLPELSPSLRLDRVQIGPWIGEDGGALSKIECDIFPLRAGEEVIPPILIRAAGRSGSSPTLAAFVQGDEASPPPASLEKRTLLWSPPDRPPRKGEAFEIRLLSDGPASSFPAANFRPPVPPNAIVEIISSESPAILALRIIPLSGGPLFLEPFPLKLGELALQSPSLELTVGEGPLPATEGRRPAYPNPPVLTNAAPASPEKRALPVLPAAEALAIPSASLRRILSQSLAERDGGRAAEALALLRSAERDLIGGPRLRPARRNLEAELGLENTPDEPWRPRSLFLGGGIGGIIVTLILIFLKKPKALPPGEEGSVTFYRSWGYHGIVFFCVCLVLACFWGFSSPGPSSGGGGGRYALIRQSDDPDWGALRAPDLESRVSFHFSEGERIRVRASQGGWIYAETGGRAGWVPADRVIFY